MISDGGPGTRPLGPDPFSTDSNNPRPWLVVSGAKLPYPNDESIAVALSTQSHHSGSIAVPQDAWIRGAPGQQSHVLAWTVATLKDELHVVGTQGTVTADFTARVVSATITYLDDGYQSGPG